MTEESKTAKNKRFCSKCDSDKTTVVIRKRVKNPKGYEHHLWHKHKEIGNWLCHNCYLRLYVSPKWNPIKNPERRKKYNPQRLKFKGKTTFVGKTLRIGVCNWCRAVVPFDCKLTHMHHEQYDSDNPSAHTIEICPQCHSDYHLQEKSSVAMHLLPLT